MVACCSLFFYFSSAAWITNDEANSGYTLHIIYIYPDGSCMIIIKVNVLYNMLVPPLVIHLGGMGLLFELERNKSIIYLIIACTMSATTDPFLDQRSYIAKATAAL